MSASKSIVNPKIKKLEKELKFLLESQSAGLVGSWERDFETNNIYATKEFFRIIGVKPPRDSKIRFSQYLKLVHPEDRNKLLTATKLASLAPDYYSTQYRLIRPDYKLIEVVINAKIIRDKQEKLIGIRGTICDFTLQQKAINDLAEAKKSAEHLAVMHEAYLANMSHEIRTPLTAILGFGDLLLQKNLKGEVKDFLDAIQISSKNLLHIINDVLDTSKIYSGVLVFEKKQFSILKMMDSLQTMFKRKAEAKQLKLEFDKDAKVPLIVEGDPTRLSQILINLIENAIKFTEKGSIKVSAEVLKKRFNIWHIEFSIKDTGIGIPTEQQKIIFNRYQQATPATPRKYGGTGLGLNICKRLIELQGGTLSLSSTVGAGSVFTLVLPFKQVHQIKAAPIKVNYAADQTNVQKLKKLEVLLAEDNLMNAKFLSNVFGMYKMKLDVAENGKEALEKMKKKKYDLILMDIQMPELNGFETTEIIRHEWKSNIPIIAITAHALAGEKNKCLQSGMNEYLTKPIAPQLLFQEINKVVFTNQTNKNYTYE
ncbi:MAG: PAS domain-containing hybrid sensor histidine kinase/response regulator [Chitinophagaceae bacterium]|nr:MAG: PAS domain-containing hybrid sensor histidine kinase/response regulator [Chitinophagaceae bacterium]